MTATDHRAVAKAVAKAVTKAAIKKAAAKRGAVMAIGDHLLVVEQSPAGAALRLVGPGGSEPLEIEITARGPVLRLRAGLTVSIAGDMSLDADSLSLRARTGDVRIQANDDVVVEGEQIKLNC